MTSGSAVSCVDILYSLNFSRVKTFTDFEVLSQIEKILASKYLFKHTFSLGNALTVQKFYPRIRKSGSAAKIFTLKKFRLYGKLIELQIFVAFYILCIRKF